MELLFCIFENVFCVNFSIYRGFSFRRCELLFVRYVYLVIIDDNLIITRLCTYRLWLDESILVSEWCISRLIIFILYMSKSMRASQIKLEFLRSNNIVRKRPYKIKVRHENEVILAVIRPKFYEIRRYYDMFAS